MCNLRSASKGNNLINQKLLKQLGRITGAFEFTTIIIMIALFCNNNTIRLGLDKYLGNTKFQCCDT